MTTVRSLLILTLAFSCMCLPTGALAQAQPEVEPMPADEDVAAPVQPVLQPTQDAPLVCDPSANAMRFLEVRGTGFDAWATQRLVGNLVDESGVAQIRWSSVWVSPQGRLTLEINLCADPFRGRPALPPGTYTLALGPGSEPPVVSTNIDLQAPPDQPDSL